MRIVKYLLLLVLLAILGAATCCYIQYRREPQEYQPPQLPREQSEKVAKAFINRKIIQEFGNEAQFSKPFDWVLTQEQANEALASMDEISFQLGGKPGQVNRELGKQGLGQPMVRFLDDRLVVLIRSSKYNKVLSAELSFESLPDGRLVVRMEAVRIGQLSVPLSLVEAEVDALKRSVSEDRKGGAGPGGNAGNIGLVSQKELGKVLREVIGAINGQPIRPVLKWPVNRRKVLVKSVELSNEQLVLHLEPIAGGDSEAASEPAELPEIFRLPG